jgi:hypothetical protein
MQCEIFGEAGRLEIPDARGDGKCCRCETKEAITNDGRFCRGCLKFLVRSLNPGSTRAYKRPPSGEHVIDRAEHKEDFGYRRFVAEGSWDNAMRACEGH